MELTFVNHAGFIVGNKRKSILCDPWLTGRAFCNGWELMSPTVLPSKLPASVDFIWFSHEHPDHFSPASLQTIPLEVRNRISILFQSGGSKDVADYCRRIGFASVVMLPPEPYEIDDGFTVLNMPYRGGDSWLHCLIDGHSLLNTNDCSITSDYDAALIKRKVGPVDVLMTKFSYAAWVGNPDQPDLWAEAAHAKLEMLQRQITTFRPRMTIPMASQIVFCHEENVYLNEGITTPAKAFGFIKSRTDSTPIVLYPGDHFTGAITHDSTRAIALYDKDLAAQRNKFVSKHINTVHVSLTDLQSATTELAAIACSHSRPSTARRHECIVRLVDSDVSIKLTAPDGAIELVAAGESPDIQLSSEMLQFCLRQPSHWDSVRLSGRMRLVSPEGYTRFANVFRVFANDHIPTDGIKGDGIGAHLLE